MQRLSNTGGKKYVKGNDESDYEHFHVETKYVIICGLSLPRSLTCDNGPWPFSVLVAYAGLARLDKII